MRWEQAVDRKISWSELWQAEPYRIKFLIASIYDVLPSPSAAEAIAEAIFTSITEQASPTSKAGDCFRPSRGEA